jgi:hypothetical protein
VTLATGAVRVHDVDVHDDACAPTLADYYADRGSEDDFDPVADSYWSAMWAQRGVQDREADVLGGVVTCFEEVEDWDPYLADSGDYEPSLVMFPDPEETNARRMRLLDAVERRRAGDPEVVELLDALRARERRAESLAAGLAAVVRYRAEPTPVPGTTAATRRVAVAPTRGPNRAPVRNPAGERAS